MLFLQPAIRDGPVAQSSSTRKGIGLAYSEEDTPLNPSFINSLWNISLLLPQPHSKINSNSHPQLI
ncbi:hypothetical protein PtA15_10A385 [Puccinia triticina]|uniref:Uncharacterized protein n=1 Tax=Puccinia triticina TaxID=208348 RepID=A0ABY7D1X3_9BASI|nr:uncharacterized protein PtA15_10A385 [Puccinia triticina]WAQ88962.1 hypothetical protein PtA15_10A385 [Puccinia triticina]